MKPRRRENPVQPLLMEPGDVPGDDQPPPGDSDSPDAAVTQPNQSRGGPPWKARTNRGHPVDLTISALQKAIRRGREREALYWGHELWTSGYAGYFWRRMLIIAHEECASDLNVAMFVGQACQNAAFASQQFKGRVEGLIEAHAILVCARAVKSREACDAAMAIETAKKEGWRIQPHDAAFDKHTAAGRAKGRDVAHFGREARRVAGNLGPNAYEFKHWGFFQEHLPRPDEPGGEPDVEIPDHTDYDRRGRPKKNGNGKNGRKNGGK